MEPVFARGPVDLRRVREEAAVVEDLVEVPDEGAAVPEVHELPLEFSDVRLDLRDPAVAVPADAVQLPLRREAEALLDQEEFFGTAAPALDELMDTAGRRVDERRRGSVDQISGGEQIRTEGRKAFPVEDPEDRPEDVVALHVRGAVERIEDDGESPAAHLLDRPHLLGGDLGHELGRLQRFDKKIVHPDVELELLFAVHVPGRGGVPPNRQLASDPGHESGDVREQPRQIAVHLRRMLRERDVRPASLLST